MKTREFLIALILTVAGVSIGWISSGRQAAADSPTTASAPVSQRANARPSVADLAAEMEKRRIAMRQADYNPLNAKLAEWSDREIIDALNASLTNPEVMLRSGAGSGLATQLWAEWMRRDFDAAITWFEELKPITLQIAVIGPIQTIWPPDKLEEGIQFAILHRELGDFGQIYVSAIAQRSSLGVGPLEALLTTMRDKEIPFYLSQPIPFPADFDFKNLVAGEEFRKLWDRGGAEMFIRGWSERDRDAAFDWLIENHGVGKLDALVPGKGLYQDHQQWLGGRISALDPDLRNEYFESNQRFWLNPGGKVAEFAKGVTDPEYLGKLRAVGVQSIAAGNVRPVMTMLEVIDDPEARLRLLETTPRPERTPSGSFDRMNEIFLRKTLAGWHAGPERINAIVHRFTSKP